MGAHLFVRVYRARVIRGEIPEHREILAPRTLSSWVSPTPQAASVVARPRPVAVPRAGVEARSQQ